MSVFGEKKTVTNSPTLLISRAGSSTVAKSVIVKSPSAASNVWLGDINVTASGGAAEGFLMEAGDVLSMDLIDEDIYAIVASSSQALYILRSQKG